MKYYLFTVMIAIAIVVGYTQYEHYSLEDEKEDLEHKIVDMKFIIKHIELEQEREDARPSLVQRTEAEIQDIQKQLDICLGTNMEVDE